MTAPTGPFRIRREPDPTMFAARVQPWLLEREAEHNVLLGLLPKLASGRHEFDDPIYLASIEQNGRAAGCAFRTPPYKLGVTRIPEGAEHLIAEDVARVYDTLPAVLGREEDAVRFATVWCERVGGTWSFGQRQRIHRLESLIEPPRVAPGELRRPTSEEHELVVEWLDAFAEESGVAGSASALLARVLIGGDDLYVWDDGGPVSMVGLPGYTPNGARVGYVYTPPDRRGRGYATTMVAEVTRRQLAAGRRFCMLYTNAANPISNRIYQQLGYEVVVDVVDVDFGSAGS